MEINSTNLNHSIKDCAIDPEKGQVIFTKKEDNTQVIVDECRKKLGVSGILKNTLSKILRGRSVYATFQDESGSKVIISTKYALEKLGIANLRQKPPMSLLSISRFCKRKLEELKSNFVFLKENIKLKLTRKLDVRPFDPQEIGKGADNTAYAMPFHPNKILKTPNLAAGIPVSEEQIQQIALGASNNAYICKKINKKLGKKSNARIIGIQDKPKYRNVKVKIRVKNPQAPASGTPKEASQTAKTLGHFEKRYETNLTKALPSLHPSQKWSAMRQIVIGVEALHSIGVAHRDLKLENLMVLNSNDKSAENFDDGSFRTDIIDWDNACLDHTLGEGAKRDLGARTNGYTFKRDSHKKSGRDDTNLSYEQYDLNMDTFATGVILYKLILGDNEAAPYKSLGFGLTDEAVNIDETLRNKCDPRLVDLIKKMCNPEIGNRISMKEVNEILKNIASEGNPIWT